MSSTHPPVVLAPLKLDAFILNESLCTRSDTFKICPITQPNYTFLRLTDSLLTADILDHVDLHTSTPAELNSRITDLGTGQTHSNRLGVYVKWTLPSVYRSGAAAAAVTTKEQFDQHQANKLQAGLPNQSIKYGDADVKSAQMRPVPDRWIVVRRLDKTSIVPKNADIPLVQAWLIESNRLHSINDADLASSDLEVEVVPFVNLNSKTGDSVVDGQAEVFVGSKTLIYPTASNAVPNPTYTNLDVLTSANPFLADYQPHNSNVFSMLDDFAYGTSNPPSRLTEATADYQVIGWHTDEVDDPFTTDSTIHPVPSRISRLKALQMRLKAPTISNPDKTSKIPWIETPDFAKTWLGDNAETRVLSHATMYGVHWKSGLTGRPTTCLADSAAANFQKQPISVGATVLDALYAYCRVHDHSDSDLDLVRMEKDVEALHNLLNTTEEDDVDALQASQDESYEQTFAKFDGETHWFFYGNTPGSNQPVVPDQQDKTRLETLNGLQRILDVGQKELARAKWELFAAWWNFVSGWAAQTTAERVPYRTKVTGLKNDVATINASCQKLQNAVDQQQLTFGSNLPQKGTGDRFYQRKDPTIMFGGIKNGWEPDFSDILPVRIADQVISSPINNLAWGITNDVFSKIAKNLPSLLSGAATGLLSEFQALAPESKVTAVSGTQTLPLFHPDTQLGHNDRNHWNNTQPWQPLFIEWEAIYTHIPWEFWKLQKMHQHSQWGHKVYKYAVTEDLAANPQNDRRIVSGRVLVLPQAADTLGNTLSQLFNSTNPQDLIELYGMTADEQSFALSKTSTVDFVSSPLDGLTSHLLTLQQGSHLKPTINLPNLKSQPIVAATAGSISDVGFAPADLLNMETNSAATPYGATALDSTLTPLKLMTHGQLMFTKINVIDKFGQAICAIDPSPRHRNRPIPTISPCLGDTYFPDLLDVDEKSKTPTGHRNTVLTADQYTTNTSANTLQAVNDQNDCPFVQLTPAMNQPARINASFCIKGSDATFQPCTEWENPIWGWLVVNYADYGLQIFLQDGTFYREVRLGGATGASAGLKWLPFDPPLNTTVTTGTTAGTDIQQLDLLIQKLTTVVNSKATYMEAFFSMIEQSLEMNQAAASSSYSTYASAIIGKPLALVNIGYSLELSGPEPKNWSLVSPAPPDRFLLADPSAPNKKLYTFDYKIGDVERTFDGLVGYFKTRNTRATSSSPMQADYDLTSLHTFFTKDMAIKGDPRKQLDSDTTPHFETLTPYWPGLPDTTKMDSTQQKDRDTLASNISTLHRAHMEIFGAIIDPFLPVHAYSALLPNVALKLPPWTLEAALSKMTAFWHAGPLVVTNDVPNVYDPTASLDAEYSQALLVPPPTDPQNAKPTVGIPLLKPISSTSGGGAQWKWLQPYWVGSKVGGVDVEETRFNAVDISGDAASGADAAEMRLEGGPYTAVEGFVQLARGAVGTAVVEAGSLQ